MNEFQAIVAATEATRRQDKPALLATVVRVRGSAYRRPGARMLLSSDGWLAGSISGGCLEADILRKAWWRTRNGERIIVTYDSTVPEEDLGEEELSSGFGLGCNGVIEVLLERLDPESPDCPIAFIADCLRSGRSGVLATIIAAAAPDTLGQRLLYREGEAAPAATTIADTTLASEIGRDCLRLLATGGSQVATYAIADNASVDVFLEVIAPPRPLVICGAGYDVASLVRMAKILGWHVTVVNPHAGVILPMDRFPGADVVLSCAPADLTRQVSLTHRTFVVVMSHNVALDAALLAAILPSPARYIGVLGPRHRADRLLTLIGSPNTSDDRLHAPIGLDIGADTPESIALSILAEMQSFENGRSSGFLRNRSLPIHGLHPEPIARHEPLEPVECPLTLPISVS